jgi:nitrate/TMAO reductase-like tetraheme cytochrome c subunit
VNVRNAFIALTRNGISLAGTAITTVSAIIFLTLFALELVGFRGSSYLGILAYLVIPGIFVVGLLLIPVGIFQERRRERAAELRGESQKGFPILDFNQARLRKLTFFVFVFTIINAILLATATYKGIEVMESTEFCGATCHSVMEPEFTAYKRSPHARVKCVSCHIGPGAGWFARSKLSGSWQLVATTLNLYPRPIPTPVHNLRPARETCEQCHLPTNFVGDRLKVITHFADDEANTELKTVLLMRVGGQWGDKSHGIHWHVDPDVQIRYRADASRETMYEVEMRTSDGTVKRYRSGVEPEGEEGGSPEWRVMDCVDCHNRPTHIYRTAAEEVDRALAQGGIDRSLPYIRREAIRVLEATGAPHEEARLAMAEELASFYRREYPELLEAHREAVEQAARMVGEIYASNVFPAMKVTWGTYPNHIGHENFPGCFRCHDDSHETAGGEVISQDCSTCHALLAMEEENPEILATLEP